MGTVVLLPLIMALAIVAIGVALLLVRVEFHSRKRGIKHAAG